MNAPSSQQETRNQEATVYVGNLDERVNDSLLWELMLQVGHVASVHLPKDRVSGTHQGYGFCEFSSAQDADYAIQVMNMIKVFGRPIRVNRASSDKGQLDVGANLFLGNLDASVDERVLYETFAVFGSIIQTPKLARDPETGESKGYGFLSFDSFEAADAAIAAMSGQFLANRTVTLSYAFKRDGRGERHGTAAERLLAAQGRKNNTGLFAMMQPGVGGQPAVAGAMPNGGDPAAMAAMGIPPPPLPAYMQGMPPPLPSGINQ